MVRQRFLVGRAAQLVVAIALTGGAGVRLHAAPAEKPIILVDATSDASYNGALLEAAVTDAENAGKILQLEAGIYRITSSLYLLPGMELIGTNETVDLDGDMVPDEISSNVFVRPQTETVIDGSAIVANPIPNHFDDCLNPPHIWPLPALGPVVAAGRQNRLARLTIQGIANATLLVAFGFDNALAVDGGWHTTIEDSVLRSGAQSFFANAGCGAVGFTSTLEVTRSVFYQQFLGMGLVNFVTANPLGDGSTLHATMRHNRFGGTVAGLFLAAGRGDAENSELGLASIGNVFENNSFGIVASGGEVLGPQLLPNFLDQLSRGNRVSLLSLQDTFTANQTGLFIRGASGFPSVPSSNTSNNRAQAELIGTNFIGNVVEDIRLVGGVGAVQDNVARLLLRHPTGGGRLTVIDNQDSSGSNNTATVIGSMKGFIVTTGWDSPPEDFFSPDR